MRFALRWLALSLGVLVAVALVVVAAASITGANYPRSGQIVFIVVGVALVSAVVLLVAKPAARRTSEKESEHDD